jgi:gliding motility-associated-like protein
MKKIILLLLGIVLATNIHAQITITNSNVALNLVKKLVGPGVTYSNATLTCATNGAATFVSTNVGLGIDSGVLLTTGLAKNGGGSNGANNSAGSFASNDMFATGSDANLLAVAQQSNSSLTLADMYDKCVLEFDFIPIGDTIKFSYKFGSEEYPEYVCADFNDVFGFFISGMPGFPSATNLALLPGTNIPISINSVNSGSLGSQAINNTNCTNLNFAWPSGAATNYVNNSASNTIVYDGMTKLLESRAVVTPCSTYHMKFAIADIFDGEFDSGVFLKAGSFKSEGVLFDTTFSPTALPINWPYSTEGCNKDTIRIKRPYPKATAQTIFVTLGGTAINGVDYVTLPSTVIIPANDTVAYIIINPIQDNIVDNNETITIGLKTVSCAGTFSDTITIILNEFPKYTVTDNDTICIGQNINLAATLQAPNADIKFIWNPGNTISNNVTITPLGTSTYTVTAKYPGCPNRDTVVKVNVAPYPTANAGLDSNICIGSTIMLNGIINSTNALYPIASINWLPAINITNGNTATPSVSPTISTAYTVTATNVAGCSKTDAVVVFAKPNINFNNMIITPISCNTTVASINVNAATGNAVNYTLMPGNITNINGIFTNLAGNTTYTITTASATYCYKSTTVVFGISIPLAFTSFTTNNITCNGVNNGTANMTVNTGGITNYNLQPNNITNSTGIFNNLSVNTYTITATNANGCTTITSFSITQPNPIIINSSNSINNVCNNGNTASININGTGGTGIINYTLLNNGSINTSGNFASLVANTYTIQLSDANGCKITTTILLQDPAAITITNIATTSALCLPSNSGNATITVVGGTGVINYNITAPIIINNNTNNVFNNLNAGIYTLLIKDANNCSKTQGFTINTVTPPNFTNISNTPIFCKGNNNASINTSIANAIGMVSYNITPSITNNNNGSFSNAAAGNYTIFATDANGCNATTFLTITQPTALTFNNISSTPTLCNSTPTGTISCNALGGTGTITYTLLNTGASNTIGSYINLGASIYTLQASDANTCTSIATITVVQPSTLNWGNATATNASCFNYTNGTINTNATGGTGTINYILNGTNNNVTGFYNNLAAGNYTISASDVNGCNISTALFITQPLPLTISNITTKAISCIPGADGGLLLATQGGTLPYNFTITNGGPLLINTTGNFNNLTAGNYAVTISDSNNCVYNTIVVLNAPTLPNQPIVTTTPTGCNPNNTGTALGTVLNANNTYNYSIGGIFAGTSAFNNLSSGNYTFTVKDTLGCIASKSFTILTTTNPAIGALITTPESCQPTCDATLEIIANGGTGILSYIFNNQSQSSNMYTGICSGSYTATVTDANGCSKTTSVSITHVPAVTIVVSGTNITCNNVNNGTITVNPGNGTPSLGNIYTISATGQSTINNNIATYTNLQAGVYTATVLDSKGCTATGTFTQINPSIVQINSINALAPLCYNGTNGAVTSSGIGGTGSLTYAISPIGTNVGGGNFNNLTGGTIYAITVTDANSCSSSATISIPQPSQLIFGNVIIDSATCWSVNDGGITTTVTGGTGNIGYNLTPLNIINTTGQFTNLFGGIFTITATDANNCIVTKTATVYQPPVFTIGSSSTTPVSCYGLTNGSATAVAIGGLGNYVFNLNGVINNTGTYNNLGGGTYTIYAKDATNCTAQTVVTVYAPNDIILNIVGFQNILCYGNADGIITSSAFGGNGGLIYSLNPMAQPSNNIGVFSPLAPNNYTLTVTDSKGCSKSKLQSITQPNILKIDSVKILNGLCSNSTNSAVKITIGGGSAPFNYQLNPGAINNNTGNFINLVSGNYTINIVDANLCSVSTMLTLNAPQAISLSTIAITNINCFGDSTGAVLLQATGGTGSFTYTNLVSFTNNTTGSFSNLRADVYSITATDANGCTGSKLISINEKPAIEIDNANIINPRCSGGKDGSLKIEASGGNGNYIYQLNNGTATANNIFSGLGLGTFTVVVSDNLGCQLDSIIKLNTPGNLIVIVDSISSVVCPGFKDGTISSRAIAGNAGGYAYTLLPANLINSTGYFANVGFGIYTISVEDTKGCTGTTIVKVNPSFDTLALQLKAVAPSCNNIGADGSIEAIVTNGNEPIKYQWSIISDSISNILQNIVSGSYVLHVIDKYGCEATDSIMVPAPPCCNVFIPNAFTPNGDADNETFKGKGPTSKILYAFNIYDRWGNLVFNTAVDGLGWDGTYKGAKLDMDTYFYTYRYYCNFDNKEYLLKGEVILIR